MRDFVICYTHDLGIVKLVKILDLDNNKTLKLCTNNEYFKLIFNVLVTTRSQQTKCYIDIPRYCTGLYLFNYGLSYFLVVKFYISTHYLNIKM